MNKLKGVIKDEQVHIKVQIVESGPKGEPGKDAKPIITWNDLDRSNK